MHEIEYLTFPETSFSKKDISAVCNEVCEENGEYHTGLSSPIQFFDCEPLSSYQDAKKFISEKDVDFYGAYAVRYLEYPEGLTSAKLEKLKETAKALRQRYDELEEKKHFADFKSAYVGCKCCGSKINVKYMNTNRCPVCRSDMRPESTLQQINDLWSKLEKVRADIKTEEIHLQEKAKKKATVKWLVKFEYHV